MNDAVRTAIEAIYKLVPEVKCKRLCQEGCGPIQMSPFEWDRIVKRLGHKPKIVDDGHLSCPMLAKDGGCGVYHIRPLVCRLWGVVLRMRCPWGCVPEKWLTDSEAMRMLTAIQEVQGSGSRMEGFFTEGVKQLLRDGFPEEAERLAQMDPNRELL